jgi:hypothetical protein
MRAQLVCYLFLGLAAIGEGTVKLCAAPVDSRKSYVEKTEDGSTTTYVDQPDASKGTFEVKVTDKSGKVTQWYQHFLDSDGKEVLEVDHIVPGDFRPPYQGIQFVTTYTYNKDRNVSETFEFYGDGTLRHKVVYVYDTHGNWVRGDMFDASGKPIGHELTPPQAHLYGVPGGGQ